MTETQEIQEKIHLYSEKMKELQTISDYQLFFEYTCKLIIIYSDIGYNHFMEQKYSDVINFLSVSNNLIGDIKLYEDKIRNSDGGGEKDLEFQDLELISQKNYAIIELSKGYLELFSNHFEESIPFFEYSEKKLKELYVQTNEPIFIIISYVSKSNQLLAEGLKSAFNGGYQKAISLLEEGKANYNRLINKELPNLLSSNIINQDEYESYLQNINFGVTQFEIESLTAQANINLVNKNLNTVIEKYKEIMDIYERTINNLPEYTPDHINKKFTADSSIHKALFYFYTGLNNKNQSNWKVAVSNFRNSILNYKSAIELYSQSGHPKNDSIRELLFNKIPLIENDIEECIKNAENLVASNQLENENNSVKEINRKLSEFVILNFKVGTIKKWKFTGKICLFINIILIIIYLYGITSIDFFNPLYEFSKVFNNIQNGFIKSLVVYLLTGGLLTILLIPFFRIWYNRHFNNEKIKSKYDSIELPEEIKNLINFH